MVKQEAQGALSTQVTIELIEYRTHVSNRTGRVVRQSIYKDSDSVRAISFVGDLLVVALVLAHCIFDGTLDIVLRHVLTLASGNDGTQCRVVLRLRAASLDSNGNLLAQLGKRTGHVAPSFQLCSFTVFKCSSHN